MLVSRIELLERLPIFAGLSQSQLGSIAGVSEKAYFQAGENLIVKDEPGDSAYVIMTGTARCLDFPGTPASADQLGPGMLVGELAMLVETAHPLTVQAASRVRAMALHRDALTFVMGQAPAIAQRIAENLLTRLQAFDRDLRKADRFLALAASAAREPMITPPDEGGRERLPRFTSFPPIPEQKKRKPLW